MQPTLHFDGPVWRPPYEATSQLLQVTAGCTWHRCKFCTLYGKQKFRMSPMPEIEEDLKVVHSFQPRVHRIFLTGANPFVLTTNRLTDIALRCKKLIVTSFVDITFSERTMLVCLFQYPVLGILLISRNTLIINIVLNIT